MQSPVEIAAITEVIIMLQSIMQCPVEIAAITEVIIMLQSIMQCPVEIAITEVIIMLQSIKQCPVEIAAITEVIIMLQSIMQCPVKIAITEVIIMLQSIKQCPVEIAITEVIIMLQSIKQCPVKLAISEVTIMLESIALWCCTRILPIPQLKYSAIYCFRVSLVQHKNIAPFGKIVKQCAVDIAITEVTIMLQSVSLVLHKNTALSAYCKFGNSEIFVRTYFRVKIKPLRNGKITLWFIGIGKSCLNREFFVNFLHHYNVSFNAICENEILAKISESTACPMT